jgi:preprotein translocase subunit SecG
MGIGPTPGGSKKLVTLCKRGSTELILLFGDGNVLSQFSHILCLGWIELSLVMGNLINTKTK